MAIRREPSPVAILAARIMRSAILNPGSKGEPRLSTYQAALAAEELYNIGRAMRRHAERCCNGDYKAYSPKTRRMEHDPEAEERADKRLDAKLARWRETWSIAAGEEQGTFDLVDVTETGGDPRGYVLRVRFKGEPARPGCHDDVPGVA